MEVPYRYDPSPVLCIAVLCNILQSCAIRCSLVCYMLQSRVRSFRTRGVCSVRRRTLTSPLALTVSRHARLRSLGSQTHLHGTNISLCEWSSAHIYHMWFCCQCVARYGFISKSHWVSLNTQLVVCGSC